MVGVCYLTDEISQLEIEGVETHQLDEGGCGVGGVHGAERADENARDGLPKMVEVGEDIVSGFLHCGIGQFPMNKRALSASRLADFMLYYPCLEAEPGGLDDSRNAYATVEPLDETRRRAELTRRVRPLDPMEPRRRRPGREGLSGRAVLCRHSAG